MTSVRGHTRIVRHYRDFEIPKGQGPSGWQSYPKGRWRAEESRARAFLNPLHLQVTKALKDAGIPKSDKGTSKPHAGPRHTRTNKTGWLVESDIFASPMSVKVTIETASGGFYGSSEHDIRLTGEYHHKALEAMERAGFDFQDDGGIIRVYPTE